MGPTHACQVFHGLQEKLQYAPTPNVILRESNQSSPTPNSGENDYEQGYSRWRNDCPSSLEGSKHYHVWLPAQIST